MSDLYPNDLSRLDRLDGLKPLDETPAPKRAIDVLSEQEAQLYREGKRVFYAAVGVLIGVLGLLGAAIVGAL